MLPFDVNKMQKSENAHIPALNCSIRVIVLPCLPVVADAEGCVRGKHGDHVSWGWEVIKSRVVKGRTRGGLGARTNSCAETTWNLLLPAADVHAHPISTRQPGSPVSFGTLGFSSAFETLLLPLRCGPC